VENTEYIHYEDIPVPDPETDPHIVPIIEVLDFQDITNHALSFYDYFKGAGNLGYIIPILLAVVIFKWLLKYVMDFRHTRKSDVIEIPLDRYFE